MNKFDYAKVRKGVGYCMEPTCKDYHKDVFLINHSRNFFCTRCGQLGKHQIEKVLFKNVLDMNFYQVRVEFKYDPGSDKFRGLAIVTDETMPKTGNVYTLRSPMIATEKRALQVAENILGHLMQANSNVFEVGVGRAPEFQLDMDLDLPEFRSRLFDLEVSLRNSRLSMKESV